MKNWLALFWNAVEGWRRDFALGLRALRQKPVFCFTAIFTLALGIGANTAIFTVLYGLLLRSLPVPDPQQLARISLVSAASTGRATASFIPYRMLQGLRREQHSFSDISAWNSSGVPMEDNDGTLRVYNVGFVSGNAFPVLELRPYFGRLIAPSDDVRGGPPEGWPTVLSYGFWKERFGGDSRTVGKQIKIANTIVNVVGIAPPDFEGVFPGFDVKLYLPLQFVTVLSGRDVLNPPTSFALSSAIGRLRPGVSLDQANAEIAVYQPQLLHQFIPAQFQHLPFYEKASLRVDSARTGLPTFFGQAYAAPLYLMQGLVGLVLLLCCVNVGGLMVSSVHARAREFAVRTAIGAPRWRLIRQYLAESFVLAFAGAALGAAAAWYGNGFLLQFFRDPNMGEWLTVHPDKAVFLVTAIFAVLTTLLFGSVPAWMAGRSDPEILLKSRTTTGSRRGAPGRAFLPVQVALSLVLVTVAALLSQSLVRMRGEYTGFDVNHVTIQTPPFNLLPQKGDAKLDVYQRMVDRIEQMPGIRSAAVTWTTPMTGYEATASFQAMTEGANPPEDSHMTYNDVGPGYFRTMRTKIIAGREFQRNERRRDVCVLNESAATYLFPHQQALGRYVTSADRDKFPDGMTCRVIGLAEDAKFASLREPPPRTIYFPLTSDALRGNLVFLMNSGTKAEAVAAYSKALAEIAPTIPLVLFATLEEQMDAALGSQRAITALCNFFGALALFLSAIGLYGLLSSMVAQRTAEIGVRMALGAQRRTVLWIVFSEALRLLGAGVVLGGAALFLAMRFVRNMLYGVAAFDPVTLAATAALLTMVALAAGLFPALRAASVDPMEALRAE